MKINTNSYAFRLTHEQIYMHRALSDDRYGRKHNRHETPPTSEDWALYHQAVQGLKALEAYDGTEWGGPDYGTEVHKPEPRVTYEWLETHDEWIARCREMEDLE
jgi:hypothetical protein